MLNTPDTIAGEKYEDKFKEYLDKLTPADMSDPRHTKLIFNLTNDLKSPGLPYLAKNRDYYKRLWQSDLALFVIRFSHRWRADEILFF